MGMFDKVFGAVREMFQGEEAEQARALALLEQEIQDSKRHIYQARESVMQLVSRQMEIEKNIKPLREAYARAEEQAMRALNRGEEALAGQQAAQMADLENEIEARRELVNSYQASIRELKQQIKNAERNVLGLEREINVIRAMDSVQKAGLNTERPGASEYAREALQRVRDRQQKREDEHAAALEVRRAGDEEGNLRERLKAAGLVGRDSSREDILERLRVEQQLRNDRVRWVKKNQY